MECTPDEINTYIPDTIDNDIVIYSENIDNINLIVAFDKFIKAIIELNYLNSNSEITQDILKRHKIELDTIIVNIKNIIIIKKEFRTRDKLSRLVNCNFMIGILINDKIHFIYEVLLSKNDSEAIKLDELLCNTRSNLNMIELSLSRKSPYLYLPSIEKLIYFNLISLVNRGLMFFGKDRFNEMIIKCKKDYLRLNYLFYTIHIKNYESELSLKYYQIFKYILSIIPYCSHEIYIKKEGVLERAAIHSEFYDREILPVKLKSLLDFINNPQKFTPMMNKYLKYKNKYITMKNNYLKLL